MTTADYELARSFVSMTPREVEAAIDAIRSQARAEGEARGRAAMREEAARVAEDWPQWGPDKDDLWDEIAAAIRALEA